ncbi:uncharacterized protein LOC128951953 [Oppia nitens]|uniref:uncharacterized protein LOC128951953 n=1 Tax=Oppia nitens TaxID=1686743 RepID=UPI0023DAE7BC|nr:uncharacterized protein LOC128951953 [Oppia nitens]
MDQNNRLNTFVDKMHTLCLQSDSTFFNDILSLNGSNDFQCISDQSVNSRHGSQSSDDISDGNKDIKSREEIRRDFCINETSLGLIGDQQMTEELNVSSNLLSDDLRELSTNITPSLDLRQDLSKRQDLFGIENHKNLFNDEIITNKTKISFNNTLGLSPVRREFIREDNSKSCSAKSLNFSDESKALFSDIKANDPIDDNFDGFQVNSFISNPLTNALNTELCDQSFYSISKCSDLELKCNDKTNSGMNIALLSPKDEVKDKSISAYFMQHSEPLSSIETFGQSFNMKRITQNNLQKEMSSINESFVSINDEMTSSETTIESVQKIIDRKSRKRKSNSSIVSIPVINQSFAPSVNSTINLYDNTLKSPPMPNKTSGLGTLSTVTAQTYSIPHPDNSQSLVLSNNNTLSLNQLLVISPNVLSLTVGCFVDFKLNYLKVKNLSITSFKAEVKINANVDTLNALDIKFPKNMINIPAFFEGLLNEDIVITPLKCGSFKLIFQFYPSIDNINLPINPLSVICHIRSEELVIKRPYFSSHCQKLHYNLFEDTLIKQTIDLCISNKSISDVISLKLLLHPNKDFMFEPLYRYPQSTIITYRCIDPFTMLLATKSLYEIHVPIIIESNTINTKSCLTVATNSSSSHVLAIFQLSATFWPKKPMTQHILQCSQTSVCLTRNQWKTIDFRNKSDKCLIRLTFECIYNNNVIEDIVKFTSSQLMIAPKEKVSIGLMADNMAFVHKENQLNILVKYDSGFPKPLSVVIPIQII